MQYILAICAGGDASKCIHMGAVIRCIATSGSGCQRHSMYARCCCVCLVMSRYQLMCAKVCIMVSINVCWNVCDGVNSCEYAKVCMVAVIVGMLLG